MKLHPLKTYNGKYVKSDSTDIRKTFKAHRKRLLREAEARRRREIKQLKGAMK